MKINAWRQEVIGFEFEARDEQGRRWELRADFSYANVGTYGYPKFILEDLNELQGRCVEGDYHAIVPSPKLMQALRDEIEENEDLAEAESQAVADGRDS